MGVVVGAGALTPHVARPAPPWYPVGQQCPRQALAHLLLHALILHQSRLLRYRQLPYPHHPVQPAAYQHHQQARPHQPSQHLLLLQCLLLPVLLAVAEVEP